MAKKENKTTVILYGCVALIVVIVAALFISYEADSSLALCLLGLLITVSSLLELIAFVYHRCKLNKMAVAYALTGVVPMFIAIGYAFPKLLVCMMILSCLIIIAGSFIVYFDYLDNYRSSKVK